MKIKLRTSKHGVGESLTRPDAVDKVIGDFEYSSDLTHLDMLWGATLRSPHASARILSIDTNAAKQLDGIAAILTSEDLPGQQNYGLMTPDQPLLCSDYVRFEGDPVAVVAGKDTETCRKALDLIRVEYEVLEPLTDPEQSETGPSVHPDGNVVRKVPIVHGNPDLIGDVIVEGVYEMGSQDQAFLGPESGMAVPAEDGGIDLYVATQGLHQDQVQLPPCLNLPPEKVRVHLAGVGGAFGGREDWSVHGHACILALHTGRPVKMSYLRDESFVGHLHRHPAKMWYQHHADLNGKLIKVEARILLDGGPYASSSVSVAGNAARFACGPYVVPNAKVEATVVRTNNHPNGAMRGFGAVQACFAHESQMDKLAIALNMDPLEIRRINVISKGDRFPTGQLVDVPAPVRECLDAAAAFPLPPEGSDNLDSYGLPGGAGRTAERSRIRRGVGYAVGYKNIAYAEGYDDDTRARVELNGEKLNIICAVAELGQGFVTIVRQIAFEVLGLLNVDLKPANTSDIGSAGSSAASRQTYMSGQVIRMACEDLGDKLRELCAEQHGVGAGTLSIREGRVVSEDRAIDVPITKISPQPVVLERQYSHRQTTGLDPITGQGNPDVSWLFAAHRAVVDVDLDLGLVRVVQLTCGQDVGKAINPLSVIGQIEGGSSQGLGLAVMEEVLLKDGKVQNGSFTDYLIPTFADMPPVEIKMIEEPEEGAPYGAKGVGETPSLCSTPAVAAAIRAATGLELPRVPIKAQDIALPAQGS
ncbi:xanthine dehydrogenase subunit D [Ruegeria atlantica]|uniref:xanthine dehydrogenase subunit D n=1 Tax=Ruegeria atlantica TaxID=81569 RepID=UPI00148088FB|nr:xanthine dehydrogenase subunit D [Ruegeria atlantica]